MVGEGGEVNVIQNASRRRQTQNASIKTRSPERNPSSCPCSHCPSFLLFAFYHHNLTFEKHFFSGELRETLPSSLQGEMDNLPVQKIWDIVQSAQINSHTHARTRTLFRQHRLGTNSQQALTTTSPLSCLPRYGHFYGKEPSVC